MPPTATAAAQLLGVALSGTDGFLYANFVAVFRGRPTPKDISDAQIRAGYHPCGYGGPYQTTVTDRGDGTFRARWNSSGTCD